MKGFTKKEREVWIAMHGMGNIDEVAEYLNMKPQNVRMTLQRGDRKLTQAVVDGWKENPYSKFTRAKAKHMPFPPAMRYKKDD